MGWSLVAPSIKPEDEFCETPQGSPLSPRSSLDKSRYEEYQSDRIGSSPVNLQQQPRILVGFSRILSLVCQDCHVVHLDHGDPEKDCQAHSNQINPKSLDVVAGQDRHEAPGHAESGIRVQPLRLFDRIEQSKESP